MRSKQTKYSKSMRSTLTPLLKVPPLQSIPRKLNNPFSNPKLSHQLQTLRSTSLNSNNSSNCALHTKFHSTFTTIAHPTSTSSQNTQTSCVQPLNKTKILITVQNHYPTIDNNPKHESGPNLQHAI